MKRLINELISSEFNEDLTHTMKKLGAFIITQQQPTKKTSKRLYVTGWIGAPKTRLYKQIFPRDLKKRDPKNRIPIGKV